MTRAKIRLSSRPRLCCLITGQGEGVVFINGIGKLRDPVTQGDEFSIAQFFVKRLMKMPGNNCLLTGCENRFGVGDQDIPGGPSGSLPSGILFAFVAGPGSDS